jgi:hypothetical protein
MIEGGVPLLSPMPAAIVAIAAGSAVGLVAALRAWGDGRCALAILAFVAIGCGELFGLVSGAERLLTAREERIRLVAAHNAPRLTALARVKAEEAAYAHAQAAAVAEAGRGGCGRACRDLRGAADQARQRLEAARGELERSPPLKAESILAATIGLPAAVLEVVPALLFTLALNGLGLALLGIGHSAGAKQDEAPPASEPAYAIPELPIEPPPADPSTRAEQVAAFCRAFREQHGREPGFKEVRHGSLLPASTVSTYRARVVG